MYIPNTRKWIHYYQNLGKDGHNPYVNYARGKQIGGGSLSGSPQQFSTPVGPSHKGGHDEKVTVNVVQQLIDQANDEVKRNIQGIKRKRADKSSKERVSSKAIEQIEENKKSRLDDIFSN